MQVVLSFTKETLPLFEATFESWLAFGRMPGVILTVLTPRGLVPQARGFCARATAAKVFDKVQLAGVMLSSNTIPESGLWSTYFQSSPGDTFWAPAGAVLLSPRLREVFQKEAEGSLAQVFGPVGSVFPVAFYRRGASKFLRPWQINMVAGRSAPLEQEVAQRLAPKYVGTRAVSLFPNSRAELFEESVVAFVKTPEAALSLRVDDAPEREPKVRATRQPKPAAPAPAPVEEGLTEPVSPRIIRRTPEAPSE